jgi:hypothetical protein
MHKCWHINSFILPLFNCIDYHLQQNGLTEELSDFQRDTVTVCHLSYKPVRQIPALLELPRSTVSAALGSGKPHKLTERDHQLLNSVVHLSFVATLTTEFQTASGSNVNTRSAHWELHEMGFHGRTATHKPKITMLKALAEVV